MSHANIALFVPHIGCPHRCSFCDQNAISGASGYPSPEAVTAACETALASLGSAASREAEVAFFGGSFTAIPRREMLRLLDAAAPYVRSGRIRGIRLSTRPDAVDGEILALLRAYGVTTIELGAQSMDDRVLDLNGRGHTAADVRRAAALVKGAGFTLGLQMMTGLYGDTPDGALATGRALRDLAPEEVRIYPTVVLRGTRLGELYRSGAYRPPDVWESVPLCASLLDLFEEAGIRVIRVGLHASPSLEQDLLAGAYHPAFRELCEGERLLTRLLRQLAGRTPGPVTLVLNPRDRSAFTGPARRNLSRLSALGWQPRLAEDPSHPRGSVTPAFPPDPDRPPSEN